MSAHAVLSPSSAHRWTVCAAAPLAERDYPDTAGPFAAEGTAAHAAAEAALRDGTTPDDADVAAYVEYVRRLGGALFIEQRLPIDNVTGEAGAAGTADAIVIDGDVLHVVDFKFGRGVKVEAEANLQLAIYAMAALELFEPVGPIATVRAHIVQPRLDHVAVVDWMPDELASLRRYVAVAADEALAVYTGISPPVYSPDAKACRWCRASGSCRAQAEAALADVTGDLVDLDADADWLPEAVANAAAPATVAALTPSHLAALLRVLDGVEQWAAAVRERALADALAGAPPPGYKVVRGRRPPAKWSDDDAAVAALQAALQAAGRQPDDAVVVKPITPAVAAKLIDLATLPDGLVLTGEGKPTLAPESDKRPALSGDVGLLGASE